MLTPTDPISATGLFCGSCGAQSSPTAKFCGEYGRRLTQATQSAARCQVLRSGLRARSAPPVPDCGFVGDVDESDSAGDVGEFAYGPTFSGCGVHQEHRVFRDREWAVLASVDVGVEIDQPATCWATRRGTR